MPVAAAAAAALVLTGAPPASAYDSGVNCGTSVSDYGAVTMTACISWATGNGNAVVSPVGKITWRNTNPSNWSSCTVKVALFVDNVQRRLDTFGCLADALTGSWTYPTEGYYSSDSVAATFCCAYKAVVQWYGVYGGNNVGSHANAVSPNAF